PVPPVVMMASTPSSAIHRLTTTRIASTSSVTISRAASLWPAAVSRSASVVPDLSSASERVSEIVSTAMLSGTNCLVSSIDIVPISLVPDAVTLRLRAGTHTTLAGGNARLGADAVRYSFIVADFTTHSLPVSRRIHRNSRVTGHAVPLSRSSRIRPWLSHKGQIEG